MIKSRQSREQKSLRKKDCGHSLSVDKYIRIRKDEEDFNVHRNDAFDDND